MPPAFLFADSFALLELVGWWRPFKKVVYSGCCNEEATEFFHLFCSQKFEPNVEVSHFNALKSTREAAQALFQQDFLFFIAGGTCEEGMLLLDGVGIDEVAQPVAGLSAGAMILFAEFLDEENELERGLARLPGRWLIQVHDEGNDWKAGRKWNAERNCKAEVLIAAERREGKIVVDSQNEQNHLILCISSHSAVKIDDVTGEITPLLNDALLLFNQTEELILKKDQRYQIK
jgi:hypothetical protein